MTADPIEAQAIQVMRDALAVVRAHPPAEVVISIVSDKQGNVRIRERVEGVPLSALTARATLAP